MLPKRICEKSWNDVTLITYGAILHSEEAYSMKIEHNYGIIKGSCMILQDIHIGIENHFNNTGYGLFVNSTLETTNFLIDYIKKMKEKFSFNSLIINGDIIDEYSLSQKSRIRLQQFILKLSELTNLILIRGNHDVMINTFNFNEKVVVLDYVLSKNILIMHGDKYLDEKIFDDIYLSKGIKRIIMGHEHPAIIITDGIRNEKIRASLLIEKVKLSSLGNISVLILPSSNPDIVGSEFNDKFMSPILSSAKSRNTHVFAHDDDNILYFGTLDTHNNK